MALALESIINEFKLDENLIKPCCSAVNVMAEAEAAISEGGHILTMPEIIDKRIATKPRTEEWQDSLWNLIFTTGTEENFIIKGSEEYAAIVHGLGIINSARMRFSFQAVDGKYSRITGDGAIRYEYHEGINLISGKLLNGNLVEVIPVSEIVNGREAPQRCVILLDYSITRNLPSGLQNIIEISRDSLAIARAGSVDRLKAYLDRVITEYAMYYKILQDVSKSWHKTFVYGNTHLFKYSHELDVHRSKQSKGRLLTLGDYIGNGFNGSNHMTNSSWMLSVIPKKN